MSDRSAQGPAGSLERQGDLECRERTAQVPQPLGRIPRDQEVIVYCRSGGRSASVQQFLMSQGFAKVKNLSGGMLAWKRDVDPAMAVR